MHIYSLMLCHINCVATRYFYSGPIFAVTELDGVRVIGPDVCDFIQKVPGTDHSTCSACRILFSHCISACSAASVSVFRPGSTSPAAILYDAWENFSNRSPKADENIRSIRPELAAAVDEMIDAAGHEWEPVWQRKLLNVSFSTLLMFRSPHKPFAGCEVWKGFLGLIQSHRLREHGPNPQGAQCCSILRNWHPYHIFSVRLSNRSFTTLRLISFQIPIPVAKSSHLSTHFPQPSSPRPPRLILPLPPTEQCPQTLGVR